MVFNIQGSRFTPRHQLDFRLERFTLGLKACAWAFIPFSYCMAFHTTQGMEDNRLFNLSPFGTSKRRRVSRLHSAVESLI